MTSADSARWSAAKGTHKPNARRSLAAERRLDPARRAPHLAASVFFHNDLLYPIALPAELPPLLQIIIDTEEEFDWGSPFSRHNTRIENLAHQRLAQRIFDRHGIRPSYVVDYAVASQTTAYGPIKEIAQDGRCDIGAHLQPWVNPPFVEETDSFHSFPGNLGGELERQKLTLLTETIADNLGVTPRLYRAGRYGLGPDSLRLIEALGYEIDSSVLPMTDLRSKYGPDFSALGPEPFWFGSRRQLLGLPLTVGYPGLLSRQHRRLYPLIGQGAGERWRAKALAARLRLIDRLSLSPEGYRLAELKRLTRHLLARGRRVFNLSYHSSSLLPGSTPYVRSAHERDLFLARLDAFLTFFAEEMKGRFATPFEIRDLLAQRRAEEAATPRGMGGG